MHFRMFSLILSCLRTLRGVSDTREIDLLENTELKDGGESRGCQGRGSLSGITNNSTYRYGHFAV